MLSKGTFNRYAVEAPFERLRDCVFYARHQFRTLGPDAYTLRCTSSSLVFSVIPFPNGAREYQRTRHTSYLEGYGEITHVFCGTGHFRSRFYGTITSA